MSSDKQAHVVRVLKETAAAHEHMTANADAIVAAAEAIITSLRQGGSVLVFGNGGSAADAQHFAAEMLGRYEKERRAWPAIGNDYGFDRIFARQVEALGRKGDVAIGISTSGNSANVLRALEAARNRGLITVALTGRGGTAGSIAGHHIAVQEARTARVQEVHATVLHVICELVERDLNG